MPQTLKPMAGCRTPVYMAPEQLQTSAAYLGTAVDVWASGVLLLVMMVRFSSFTARDGPRWGLGPT